MTNYRVTLRGFFGQVVCSHTLPAKNRVQAVRIVDAMAGEPWKTSEFAR